MLIATSFTLSGIHLPYNSLKNVACANDASVTLLPSVMISIACILIFFNTESDYFLVNTMKIINFVRKKSGFSFSMYLQSTSGCPSPAVCQAHCPDYKIIRFICSQSGLKQKVMRSTSIVIVEEDEDSKLE